MFDLTEVFFMRYALFGRGEGVRVICDQPVWASALRDVVTDASVSARERGIRVGMSRSTAEALVPEVVWCAEDGQASVMEGVWRALWQFSPWLETIDRDAFCLQISGRTVPLREVRGLLQQLDATLSTEQRLRTGLAENPFLARALVEWSWWERVPGAMYRKAGRQQLIVSPGIASGSAAASPAHVTAPALSWVAGFPVQAMWLLPEQTRMALLQLGVRRLQDLQDIGAERLHRQFGKEANLWLRWLWQVPGQSVRVNYPPPEWRETWRANIDEAADRSGLPGLAESLATALAARLERAELGALVVGVTWQADIGTGGFERAAKRPAWRKDAILAQVRVGLAECTGRHIEELVVYARDLRPLSSVQLMWDIREGVLEQASRQAGEDVRKLVIQVNRKYPNGLCIGVRPGFRELRLQAVLGT